MIIEYKITAKCENKVMSLPIEFTKTMSYDIEDVLLENNKDYLIYDGSLFNAISDVLGDYIANNNLSVNDINIKSVDVTTDNEEVELIISKDELYLVNFNVKIYACYNSMLSIDNIFLAGEVVGNTSIKLFFSDPHNAHKVFDDENKLLYFVPIGESERIEENLEPGKTYYRKVISYNGLSESSYSNIIELTTTNEVKVAPTDIYKSYSRENNIVNIPTIDYGLKAFKSGIGNGNDLKMYKPNDVSYVDSFGVQANLYGKYSKATYTYQKASFEYRTVCIGKYNEQTTDGFVRFKFNAKTSGSIKLRVYRYAHRNIDINWLASAWISYKAPGNPLSQVMQIRLDSERYTLTPSVKYNGKNAYLEPKNNLLVKSKPLKRLITDYASSKYGISSSQIEKVFDYALYDTCSFDRYTTNVAWDMKTASLGTFSIHTMDKAIIDENSNIYGSGYSNAQLFDAEEIIEKTFYGDKGTVDVLTLDEINSIVPTNVDDRSESVNSSNTNIITKIDIISVDTGLTLNEINMSNKKVLTANANLINSTPEIQYKFDNNTNEIMVNTDKLISNVDDSLEYEYGLVVIGCTDNITLTYGRFNENEGLLTQGQVLKWIDTGHSNLLFKASSATVVRLYEDVLPKYENDPYYGVINGTIDENGECHKKDMIVQTPMFTIPEKVYDAKFKILLQNIRPSEAHVDYKFSNSNEANSTSINGDFVLFTSDASKKHEKEFMDLLSVYDYDNLHVIDDDESSIDLSISINKPSTEFISKYDKFIVNISPKAVDVSIDGYEELIEFKQSSSVDVPFKAKVRKNATSKWCPLINNGYYYMNQNEYYLFSKNDIASNYEDSYSYSAKTSIYNVNILAKKTNNELNNKVYSYRNRTDYNISDNLIFENNYIFPKAVVNGIYYKEYKPTESIIKEINFDSVVKSYNYIKWDMSASGEQDFDVSIRSYNSEVDSWNDWETVTDNSKPKSLPSYKMQIKISFNPKVEYKFSKLKDTLSTYNEFKEEMDESLSHNIYLLGGGIQSFNGESGTYISKVLKFETATKFRINSYYTVPSQNSDYKISIHVAASNDVEELTKNPYWEVMDGTTTASGKYFRYRINIIGRVNVVTLYKDIETLSTMTEVKGINNIQLSVEFNETNNEEKLFTLTKSYTIIYNAKEEVINYNLMSDIDYYVSNNGYDKDDIIDVSVENNDEDIELSLKPLEYDFANQNLSFIFRGWKSTEQWSKSWMFNETDKSLICLKDVGRPNCFFSPIKYSDFRINAKLNSTDFTSNPIGVVIGYEKDYNNKEHILTLLVSPSDKLNSQRSVVRYSVYYNYGMENEKLIYNGNDLITEDSLDSWEKSNGIYVDVQRVGNNLTIYRSQNDKNTVDVSTCINVNINDYPILMLFKNRSCFGFYSHNQANCIFTNMHVQINDKLNSVLTAKTKFTNTIATTNDIIEFENNKARMSPLPQQYSPVLVETFDYEPLKRVYFINEGRYCLTNVETFEDVTYSIQLSHTDIDIDSIKIYVDDKLIDNNSSNYDVVNNYIFFNDVCSNSKVRIIYKLNESFVVNYDFDSNEIEIEINTKKDNSKAFVKYETNEYDSRYKISHLSLNPIYNGAYGGFIYITDKTYKPVKIIANYNPKYVFANGNDFVNVCVQVVDVNSNSVPGEKINVECKYGLIEYTNDISDQNGVIVFKYHSASHSCIDEIKISNDKNNLISKIDIENLEV